MASNAAPAAMRAEAVRTLEALERDAQELREGSEGAQSFALTEREVSTLRTAFTKAVEGVEESAWPAVAHQCDDVLRQLEGLVEKTPSAKSGDLDKELQGAENYAFLKIPLQRRLQTFIISLFLFFTGLPFFSILTVLLLLNVYTCPFMVAYLLYIFFYPIRHPVPQWKPWRRGFVMRNYRDYFPVRCVAKKEVRDAIDPKRNYLFCYHPHGVHSFGAVVNFGSDTTSTPKLFPGLTFHIQTLKINFYVPFWREIMLWGGSGDASADCIKKTLRSGPGQCVVLVVGGAEESMLAAPKTNNLFLAKRKGFVKLALQMGSPLVPCFGFGENNVYHNLADGRPWLQRLVKTCQKRFGFAPLLVGGRGYFNYNFGILPHRRPIVTVVGKPVDVPQIEKPTQEDIDKYHKLYVDALLELYQQNRGIYDVFNETGATIR